MDVLIAMVVKMKEQFRPHIATGMCVCMGYGVYVQYIMAVCVCMRVCIWKC